MANKEFNTRFEEIGLAKQPRAISTNTPPVCDGATANAWTNPANLSTTNDFFPIHGMPGTITPNRNANINDLSTTNGVTSYATTQKIVANLGGVIPTVDMQAYANPTTMVAFFLASLQGWTHTNPDTDIYSYVISPTGANLDFTDNEGHLFSIGGNIEGTSENSGFILKNGIINTLSWTLQNTGGVDGIAQMSAQWMGTELLMNQSVAATFSAALQNDLIGATKNANNRFSLDLTSTGLGGTISDICWRTVAMTSNTNVSSDCFAGSEGSPNNFKRSTPELTFNFSLPYNNSTLKLVDDYSTSNNVAVRFKNQFAADTVGLVDFNIANAIMTAEPRGINGEWFSIGLQIKALVDETDLDNNTITIVAEDDFTQGLT